MSRGTRFEVVRTDDGHHARFLTNGHIIMSSEVYTRRRGALGAIRVIAEAFSHDGVVWLDQATQTVNVHGARIPVRDVDERTP